MMSNLARTCEPIRLTSLFSTTSAQRSNSLQTNERTLTQAKHRVLPYQDGPVRILYRGNNCLYILRLRRQQMNEKPKSKFERAQRRDRLAGEHHCWVGTGQQRARKVYTQHASTMGDMQPNCHVVTKYYLETIL
jgi:hypothetical protein